MLDTEVRELLRLLDATFPAVDEMTGAQARAAVAARRQPVANLDDVERAEDRTIVTDDGSLPVRIYTPHGATGPSPAIVFCHGGGFVFCDIDSHDGFCREMSRRAGAVVVSVGYRLAPEHKAPAAAHDAYAALCWTVAHAAEIGVDAARVAVAGDSAGGNLAAAVCLMARDNGGPHVAAQVLAYPVLDPSCDSGSFRRYGSGYFNTAAAMEWYWRQYLPAGEPGPYIAPARAADLAGLPPALVVTAGLDPLHDEGAAYAAALRGAGVRTVHRDYPGLFHGFLTIATLRAGRAARELLWRDLRAVLAVGEVSG